MIKSYMEDTGINDKVLDILDKIDINDTKALQAAAEEIKSIIIETPIPDDMIMFIKEAYNQLCQRVGEDDTDVAIRNVGHHFLKQEQFFTVKKMTLNTQKY